MVFLKKMAAVSASGGAGFALLVFWTALAVYVCHARAAASTLRYGIVAEGNISEAVHAMWSRGADGYGDVLRGDACQAGRVRPVQWLYHGVPFFLAMVRNGDFFRQDPGVPRSERINGDLQTHVAFLMVSVALAMAFLAYTLGDVIQNRWAGFLVPVYAAASLALAENLIVNFCDSQEIGQLLFVSVYLFCVRKLFRGEAPGVFLETVGVLFLLLAYGMKETTVVLMPCMLAVLVLQWRPSSGASPAFRRFAARHAMAHLLMAGLMAVAVMAFRSGGYAANYGASASLADNASRSFFLLSVSGPPVWHCLWVAGLFYAGLAFYEYRTGSRIDRGLTSSERLVLCFLGLSAGFWIVNLPWPFQLIKYYYPAFVFAAMALVAVQVLIARSLWRHGFKTAAVLWLAGSVVFVARDAGDQKVKLAGYYKDHYEIRKAIRAVSEDLGRVLPEPGSTLGVHIVAGRLAPGGRLPFLRVMNRFQRANISSGGTVVSSVPGTERNYFLRYPAAGALDMDISEAVPDRLTAPRVYTVNCTSTNDSGKMRLLGYSLEREWSVGSPGATIGVYTRR